MSKGASGSDGMPEHSDAHNDERVDDRESAERGYSVIAAYAAQLDGAPGVYRMLDEESRVLYVGKARNLKARVRSYARPSPQHSARITRMISQTVSMMFLSTRTETEALLLEQNLIKQLKPKYNVLLRDDKMFPSIVVRKTHDFPQIARHRGAKGDDGRYFGPFANGGAVTRTLTQLQRVFRLRNCSDSDFQSRSRPCLQYQIKRCSGPCTGLISREDYAASIAQAEAFLMGQTHDIQKSLADKMQVASEAMEFERAAVFRDQIKALTHVQGAQGVNPQATPEADVFALHLDGGQACVQVFFIRANQNWGNHDYYPRIGGEEDPSVILEAFVGQFYAQRETPKVVLLSHGLDNGPLMGQALSEKAGHKVECLVPMRGEKLELVQGALRNAKESLARKMAQSATQKQLLRGVADVFGLPHPPKRVEVYDNSHIQGAHAVGAMIVAGDDGFLKSQYRKFNIKGTELTPGDDFGMMKEVLTRRLTRLLKEDPDRKTDMWPDLLLIDGGAGQVSAVHEILTEFGVADIAMVGVAKGEERNAGNEVFHRIGRPILALRRNDPILYFIQRLRDEAHRFAIGTHRSKRSQAIRQSQLDLVPGVGATRKRALLSHFGSAKAVSRADLSDLRAVPGVSAKLAKVIYDFFHENGS